MGGRRELPAIVLGVVLVLVAAVAIVLAGANRAPRAYPTGSPEAALQAYLGAWEAGDYDRAWSWFSASVREKTSQQDYRRQALDFRGNNIPPGGSNRRVFITSTTLSGDRASLQLTIEETFVNGLNAFTNRYGRALSMVHEDADWRLDALLMGLDPWFIDKAAPYP